MGGTARLAVFVMGISSRLVLPCLATECHAFGLKIATAALQPRNDTKMRRFCLRNKRSWLYEGAFD